MQPRPRRPLPAAAGQHGLGRARARRGARSPGHDLGRHLRPGDLPAAGRGHGAGSSIRSDTTPGVALLGLRPRLRASGRGARSGTARWGTAGDCRWTAARPGRTGPTSSSAPSGSTSPPAGIVVRGDTTVIGPPTASRSPPTTAPTGPRSWIRSALRRKGPADTALSAARQRVRAPAGRRPARLDRRHAPRQPAAPSHRARAGWASRARWRGVSAGRRAARSAGKSYRGGPCGLRPAPTRLPCLRGDSAAGASAGRAAHHLVRAAHRPTDNSFIDQTYRYGSTMGGNFQQHQGVEFNNPDGTPVLAIGAGDRGVCRTGGGGRADGHHPARHHGHRQTAVATGSTPPTTTTRRSLVQRRATGCDAGAGDRPGGQHRPRDQRSPAPRDVGLAHRFAAARSWTRCSVSRPTPPTPSSGSSRCRAPASWRGRSSMRAGAPVPQARIYGIMKRDADRDAVLLRRDLRRQGALASAVRRALRGERRAGRHATSWGPRSRGRRCCGRSRSSRGS